MINANWTGNPSAGTCRLARSPVFTSLVAPTTRVLIEAIAAVNLGRAAAASSGGLESLRESAVELMMAAYYLMSVKRAAMRDVAAGSSAGDRRSSNVLGEGDRAAKESALKVPARARRAENFILMVCWAEKKHWYQSSIVNCWIDWDDFRNESCIGEVECTLYAFSANSIFAMIHELRHDLQERFCSVKEHPPCLPFARERY